MPPEPLQWDRRRSSSRSSSENLGGGGSSRWRDSASYHHPHRWGTNEFRRPPGYGKQGGWNMYPEDSFRGYGPSRSNDKIMDEEIWRPSARYGRNSGRENRSGPFSRRDWKGRGGWDVAPAAASLNGPVRTHADVNGKRLVDDILPCKSRPHFDSGNNSERFDPKDEHDEKGGVSGSFTGQKLERESSLGSVGWKSLKWTCPGSLSSHGSGFSLSSTSKCMGVDFIETKVEIHPQNVSPVESPSGDAAACVTSGSPADETSSRKKPRLGWGEGLAKYEKKKVDGPDDTAGCNGMIICESNTEPVSKDPAKYVKEKVYGPDDTAGRNEMIICESNMEPVHEEPAKYEKEKVDGPDNIAGKDGMICESNTEPLLSHISDATDGSPKEPLSDCASPATLSSVACSSSPGLEDKPFVKALTVDTTNLCGSPCLESQNQSHGLAFNIDNLEVTPIANLSSSITELLQFDDPSSVDCGFLRSTSMNKLLVLKAEISKKLEVTESEIDSLENEMKSMISGSENASPLPASSSSLPEVCILDEEPCAASSLIHRPALQLNSTGDVIKEKSIVPLEVELAECRDEDIDSPGSATSKFAEPLSVGKAVSQDVITLTHAEFSANADTGGTEDVKVDNEENTEESTRVIVTRENMLCDLIMASNKDSAQRASEVLSKLLPANLSSLEISKVDSGSRLKINTSVKDKFIMRKRFLMFKERVMTLKFRVFQHLWKEDLRLLSIRRSHVKSQKKFESSSRMVHSSYRKHRSSIRSRFSSPAGNLSLVPTTEVINFASKLLEDSHVKMYRSALKMPALICDMKEKTSSRFITSNGLVEDPCAAEKEKSLINPWTSNEKEIFLENLDIFGKDFRKIASFLDHKTTADCVEFYYKNHKSDSFQKMKKKPEFSKHGKSISTKHTYMVTSGKRWNRESNSASLDMLGEASAIAANVDHGLKGQQKCTLRSERSTSVDILGSNERETVAADVLAGICGSLSSEAMSSCVTSSIDQERKYQTVVTQIIDEETCSDDSCGELNPTDWTDEEKSLFIQAVLAYGKDFTMISRCVRTRSRDQCKVFFSKARKCLGLDMMHPRAVNDGSPANGRGGSDTEDACVVETDKSGSKMDEDLPLSNLKANNIEFNPEVAMNMDPDIDQLVEDDMTGKFDVNNTEFSRDKVVSGNYAVDNADLDFAGDRKIENFVGSELAVQVLENGFATRDINTGQNEITENGSLEKLLTSPPVANDVGKHSISAIETESESEVQAEIPNVSSSMNDKQVEIADIRLGTGTVPLSAGNASLSLGTDSLATGVLLGHDHGNAGKLDPMKIPCVESLKQPACYLNTNFVSQDPPAAQNEKGLLNHDMGSNFDSEKISNKKSQSSLLDHVDSSQILSGYPVSLSTKNGINMDVRSNRSASLQGISKVDRSFQSDRFLARDSYLQKCNDSKQHDTGAKNLHLMSQDRSKDHPRRPRPRSSSDSEKPDHNGDVKLFGQILSKPTSRAHETEDSRGATRHAKLSDNSFNLKFTGNRQNADGILASSKFDRNNYLGLENFPVRRSFGFWDGNRIQTGFPSLPDSAVLLAKYPAAFSNYQGSTSKVGTPQLHSIARSNNINLNGASVFPTSGSKVVADYHQGYRSRIELKQRQDMFISELQKRRNELSLQQQARGIMGINVMGRGGVLRGGPVGVSDPVAAIRLHYARAEQYGGPARSSIVREEEPWRGNHRDIGR